MKILFNLCFFIIKYIHCSNLEFDNRLKKIKIDKSNYIQIPKNNISIIQNSIAVYDGKYLKILINKLENLGDNLYQKTTVWISLPGNNVSIAKITKQAKIVKNDYKILSERISENKINDTNYYFVKNNANYKIIMTKYKKPTFLIKLINPKWITKTL